MGSFTEPQVFVACQRRSVGSSCKGAASVLSRAIMFSMDLGFFHGLPSPLNAPDLSPATIRESSRCLSINLLLGLYPMQDWSKIRDGCSSG